MKNFALYLFSAVLVFAAAFGLTEYLMGTSNVLGAGSTSFLGFEKVSEYSKEEISLTQEEEEQLKLIILEAERKNRRVKFAPVWQGDMKYNLHILNEKQGHFFITLGNVNVVFEDASKGGYEIVNAEEIISEIDKLLEK